MVATQAVNQRSIGDAEESRKILEREKENERQSILRYTRDLASKLVVPISKGNHSILFKCKPVSLLMVIVYS